MSRGFLIAAMVAGSIASASQADVVINLGNLDASSTIVSMDITALIAADTYSGYSVSFDWSAIGGDPWSAEGIWALSSEGTPFTSATFYADPGASGDSENDGDPIHLTWSGVLDNQINPGDPVFFSMLQTFTGSSANWDNVSITLVSVPAPGAFALLGLGGAMAVRRRRA